LIQVLWKILYRFKGKIIDLWVDYAQWYKRARMEEVTNEHSFLHIHHLLPSHPELNYQEAMARHEIRGNNRCLYETISDINHVVFKRSQNTGNKKDKRTMPIHLGHLL
jgi:hypothetical protein